MTLVSNGVWSNPTLKPPSDYRKKLSRVVRTMRGVGARAVDHARDLVPGQFPRAALSLAIDLKARFVFQMIKGRCHFKGE